MAPGQKPAEKKGARAKSNALHKKRRVDRNLPKVNKKTNKNCIRDLERRLRRLRQGGDNADAVAECEAKLAALRETEEAAAAGRAKAEREKRYAERYRRVKFFELQKARRRLKKLRRELAARPAAAGDAAKLERLEGDVLYIKFYPKDRKYVGLFTVRGEDDAKTKRRRESARKAALAAAEAAAAAEEEASSSSGESSEDGEEGDDFFVADDG